MARLRLKLFGPFEVSLGGQAVTGFDSDKVRALLAYLVVEADQPHRREKLAGLLWPDFPEGSARTNLRRALSNLRTVIGDRDAEPPFLFISRQTIQFNALSDTWVDVATFLQLISNQLSTTQELEEAAALYRGAFLDGLSVPDSVGFEEWLRINRESLQQLAIGAFHRAASLYAEDEQYEPAIRFARRQIELEPYREEAYRQLMRFLVCSGQRSDALAQFEVLKVVLAEELDVEPDSASTALYESIRAGDFEPRSAGIGSQTIRGYELRELIGHGHYGAVYRAYQPVIGRDVAIKAILPSYADDPGFIRRFEFEAQLAARLEHPAIVPLYDYWREPGGAFLVMRWLRGGSLKTTLERGPWSTTSAVRLVDQVAAALNVAHRQGVIHRDLKPGNILLDEEGNAYLSDFGLASLVGPLWAPGENLPAIFSDDTWVSLGYQSPVTIEHGRATPETDIYSFGVVLYELLAARHPFPDCRGQELLDKHLTEPLPSIRLLRPELPPAVDEVIQRATAKDPGERFVTVLALAAAFRQAVEGETFFKPVPGVEIEIKNPYKGLRAFQAADAADFFGREMLLKRLLAYLENNRFLAVVGPSGSGKSSLVKAGLVHALRRGALPGSEEWFFAELTPGSRPMEELETALLRIAVNAPESLLGQMQDDARGLLKAVRRSLPDDESQLFLVIDQFEELFTLVEEEEDRIRFLNSLLVAVQAENSPLLLTITLRADYYDRPLQYASFGELTRQNTEVVLPLSPDELERAIAGPAERVGLSVESGLVTEIVADVVDRPGTLPLLQYALTEMFEQRDENKLNLKTYRTIGGVTGALARRAEELYAALDDIGHEAARQIFLRLVTLDEEGEYIRRRVLRSEITTLNIGESPTKGGYLEDIVDIFGSARLLTFDRDASSRAPTVEVAHEAILREWKRLQGWLVENRSDLILHQQLMRAACDWSSAGGEESFLLRGERLTQFESWASEGQLALSEPDRAYLEASIALREEKAAAERQRQEWEARLSKRSARRLRALVFVGSAALVVIAGLVIAAVFSTSERRQIEENQRLTLLQDLSSAALDSMDTDPELSVLLALEAAEIALAADDSLSPELEELLHRAVQADGVHLTIRMGGAIAYSPDGQLVAVGDEDGLIRMWDPVTGQDEWDVVRYQEHHEEVGDVAFSPDGRFLATSSPETSVMIWDVRSGQEIGAIESPEGFRSVVFSPDNRKIMTAGGDGSLRLWDLEPATSDISEGTQPVELMESNLFRQESTAIGDVIYCPDGQRLAGLVPGMYITVLDAVSGEELLKIPGVGGSASEIAFSPDGHFLAGSSNDLRAMVWDSTTGEDVLSVVDYSIITQVDFSPDGRYLATATEDGKVTLWDLESGARAYRLSGHSGRVNDMSFSPGGRQLASSDKNKLTRIWDLDQASSELFTLVAHQGPVHDAIFNADGTLIASAGDDGLVKVWDVETGLVLHDIPGPREWAHFPAFRPNSQQLAAANRDGGVTIWDARSGLKLLVLDGDAPAYTAVTFNYDGSRLASGSQDGDIHIWDVDTGQRLTDIRTDGDNIAKLIFSPAGNIIFSADQAGRITTWNADTGANLHSTQCPNYSQIDAETTADGQLTAVACNDIFVVQGWSELDTETYLWWLDSGWGLATGVAFSADGTILATSDSREEIRLWDMETGEKRLTLVELEVPQDRFEIIGPVVPSDALYQSINGVDFSPDGRYLASAVSDGTVRVYIMTVEELIAEARSRLSRGFSQVECQTYLSLDSCQEEP